MIFCEARQIAWQLRDALEPACTDILIAGSLRRGKPEVGDIELVILPRWDTDLFGGESRQPSALEAALDRLVASGTLAWHMLNRANGPRLKRLVHREPEITIELFLADEDNFGCISAIRTGDTDFSHNLVMDVRCGGCMPTDMYQGDGHLYHRRETDPWPGKLIPCRTEDDYFSALGLPTPDPAQRNSIEVGRLAKIAHDTHRKARR